MWLRDLADGSTSTSIEARVLATEALLAAACSPRSRHDTARTPGGGPHPLRQGHRLRPATVPALGINAVWLQLALTTVDLLPWTQSILLDGELAGADDVDAAAHPPVAYVSRTVRIDGWSRQVRDTAPPTWRVIVAGQTTNRPLRMIADSKRTTVPATVAELVNSPLITCSHGA